MKVTVKFVSVLKDKEGNRESRPFAYKEGKLIGELFPAHWLKDGKEVDIYPVSMHHRGETKIFNPICPCCKEAYETGLRILENSRFGKF